MAERVWNVCRALPAYVPLIVSGCVEAGGHAYFPVIPHTSRGAHHRRPALRMIQAYPGYFFLRADSRDKVSSAHLSLFSYLRFSRLGEFVRLDELDVLAIKADEKAWAEQHGIKQKPEVPPFRPGDEVRITSGLFGRRVGVVESVSDNLSVVSVGGVKLRINHFLLEPKKGRKETA